MRRKIKIIFEEITKIVNYFDITLDLPRRNNQQSYRLNYNYIIVKNSECLYLFYT